MDLFFDKKSTLIGLFILFASNSFAQFPAMPGSTTPTVGPGSQGDRMLNQHFITTKNIPEEDFELVSDNPELLRILALDIPIYSAKISSMETNWFEMRPGISYLGKGKLNGGFSYRISLITMGSRTIDNYFTNATPVEPIKNSKEFDAYLNFFFFEKLFEKKEGILVEAKRSIYTLALTNMHNLKKFGISVGAYGGKLNYNLGRTNLNLISYNQPTTTLSDKFSDQYTVQNYFVLKAGAVYNRLTDAEINTKKYGKKIGSTSWLISANLLYAVKNNFQDVNVGNNNQTTRYVIDHSIMKKNNIGIELCARYTVRGNALSMEAKYRYHPGLANVFSSMYMVSINYQLDFFHLKEFNGFHL